MILIARSCWRHSVCASATAPTQLMRHHCARPATAGAEHLPSHRTNLPCLPCKQHCYTLSTPLLAEWGRVGQKHRSCPPSTKPGKLMQAHVLLYHRPPADVRGQTVQERAPRLQLRAHARAPRAPATPPQDQPSHMQAAPDGAQSPHTDLPHTLLRLCREMTPASLGCTGA